MRFVNFLIKPASSLCNMRCRYCFYEDIAVNREQKNMGIMEPHTVDQLLEAAYEAVDLGGTVSFAFQGGEPTVAGLTYFRQFVSKAKERCPEGVNILFSIQTNGLLIDEDWAEFLKEHDFLVGLSLDGYKDLHDLYRVDAQGEGTWTRLCKTLTLLQKKGVRVNILCVVTAQCAKHPEKVYQTLKKLGVEFMQFIPCMDPIGCQRGKLQFSLTAEAYGRFLCRLFDLWYQDWERGQYRSVRLFEDYVHMILGHRSGTCATCGRCGGYFVVEGDGSVYPCDFYVLDEWEIGQLGKGTLEEMARSKVCSDFLLQGSQKPAECAACRWKALCNGGCKHDWVMAGDGEHNYFCTAFRQLFSEAERRMLTVARAEQEAMKETSRK